MGRDLRHIQHGACVPKLYLWPTYAKRGTRGQIHSRAKSRDKESGLSEDSSTLGLHDGLFSLILDVCCYSQRLLLCVNIQSSKLGFLCVQIRPYAIFPISC